jgi:hypothetical protein
MANLSITVASVRQPTTNPLTETGIAGEALTRGQVAVLKSVDNKWYKADATTDTNAGNGEGAGRIRIVLSDVSTDQIVLLLKPGQKYTVGATLSLGKQYTLSATSALICPNTDLVTGNRYTVLGYPASTTELNFAPDSTGQILP